jgi:hypothetical protein
MQPAQKEIGNPPEEDWLPGRLLGPVLYDPSQLRVAFEDAHVYPVGILLPRQPAGGASPAVMEVSDAARLLLAELGRRHSA